MNKIPLTIALFTSTKGHWGIKDRYLETIKDLDRQIPLNQFENLIANIKFEKDDNDLHSIAETLNKYGFNTYLNYGNWSHGEQSHQDGYLSDIELVYNQASVLKVPYVLHCEDDWLFHCYENNSSHWINEAIAILDEHPEVSQVRFARFSNEFERIQNLYQKHGIKSFVAKIDDNCFLHNDFSLNPSIFRSRDMMTAINFTNKNPQFFSRHVEHGLGSAFKYLYDKTSIPFACLNPNKIKVCHIGSPLGEEDTTAPLISN